MPTSGASNVLILKQIYKYRDAAPCIMQGLGEKCFEFGKARYSLDGLENRPEKG
jgi:hypothetical protein